MDSALTRAHAIAASLVVAVFFINVRLALRNLREVAATEEWVTHTHEVQRS